MIKNKKVLLAFFLTLIIWLVLLIPNFCNAASTVSVSFKDKNLYRAIINNLNLEPCIVSKNSENLTVKFDKIDFKYASNFKELEFSDKYKIQDLSGMEKFTRLEHLYVGSTNLKDISAITKLTKLKSLIINSYSEDIGNKLGKITTLNELRIYSKGISKLYGIKNLINLKMLILDTTIIVDEHTNTVQMQNMDIAGIKNLKNLTQLHIIGNDIDSINELEYLKKLKTLGIDMSRESCPDVISKLTNLTSLDLVIHPQYYNDNYIGVDISKILSKLTKLEHLSLVHTKMLNNDITIIKKLKNLTYLDLSYTNITDLTPLSKLTKLERVEANGNNIKDISVLNNLNNLKDMYIDSIYEGNIIPQKKLTIKNKDQSTKSITLKWNKDSGVTGYALYKYDTSKKKYIRIATTKDTSYKVTGLKPGTTYKFKIRAYRKVCKKNYYGDYSSVAKLTTVTTQPKISKLSTKSKKVTIKWKKVIGASGYQIYMSTSKNGIYSKIKTITKGSTVSYTKTKLKKSKKYYFKIRTYRTVNGKKVYSSFSNIKSIKVK